MIIGRRALLLGLASTVVAAPAIVRASSIMPVRPWRAPVIEKWPWPMPIDHPMCRSAADFFLDWEYYDNHATGEVVAIRIPFVVRVT